MARLSFLIPAVATVLLCAALHAGEKQDRARLKSLGKDIQKLQQSIAGSSSQRDSLSKELQKAEVERARFHQQISALETELKGIRSQLLAFNKSKLSLEKSRRNQQHLMTSQINAAYRLGREESIKLLLNQEDPERISRTLKYYDYFLQARTKKLDQYIETIRSLAKVELNISTQEVRLSQNRDQLKQQQQRLAAKQQQRKQVLAKLDQQIKSTSQQLTKLKSERQHLETVLKAIEETITKLSPATAVQPFARTKGKLGKPVRGKLIHRFGSRRNANLKWDGWMLAAAEGTPVSAIHHGRVVFSDYLRGQGLLLIIDHGDGYMSLYAHNQVLLKDTGDWVQPGELISKVGNTGGQAKSALYFEIRHNGKPANPSRWISSG